MFGEKKPLNGGTIYMRLGTISLLNSIVFGDISFEPVELFNDYYGGSVEYNIVNSAFNIFEGKIIGTHTQNINIENNTAATPEKVFLTGKLEENILKINQFGLVAGTGVWVGHQDDFKVINYSVPGSNVWTPFVGDSPVEPANIIKNSFRGATAPVLTK